MIGELDGLDAGLEASAGPAPQAGLARVEKSTTFSASAARGGQFRVAADGFKVGMKSCLSATVQVGQAETTYFTILPQAGRRCCRRHSARLLRRLRCSARALRNRSGHRGKSTSMPALLSTLTTASPISG